MSDSGSEIVFTNTEENNIRSSSCDEVNRNIQLTGQMGDNDSEAGGDQNNGRSPSQTQRQRYLEMRTNRSYSLSPIHHRSENNSITMKPDLYTGESDWEIFEAQFEVCAKLGNWNQRTKALVLAGSLRGKALEFYSHLPTEIKEHYDLLISRFEQRFGGGNQRSKWLSLLEARVRIPGESASRFADAIQLMIRKAYPHLDPSAQELMTFHTIYRDLGQDLKYKCIVENCKSVAHAVQIIDTYEGIFGSGHNKMNQ